MRPILISLPGLMLAGSAGAHTLAADESPLAQLGHQLTGLHHLPLLALIIFGGLLLVRHWIGARGRSADRRR